MAVTRSSPSSSALWGAFGLFLAGYTLHSVFHMTRGLEYTPPAVMALGMAAWVVVPVWAIFLILGRLRVAAGFTVLFGFATPLLLSVVHLPPSWGVFSDVWRHEIPPFGWVSLVIGSVCGVTAGVIGIRELRRDRTQAVSTARTPAGVR